MSVFFKPYDTVNHCKMHTLMIILKSSYFVHVKELN